MDKEHTLTREYISKIKSILMHSGVSSDHTAKILTSNFKIFHLEYFKKAAIYPCDDDYMELIYDFMLTVKNKDNTVVNYIFHQILKCSERVEVYKLREIFDKEKENGFNLSEIRNLLLENKDKTTDDILASMQDGLSEYLQNYYKTVEESKDTLKEMIEDIKKNNFLLDRKEEVVKESINDEGRNQSEETKNDSKRIEQKESTTQSKENKEKEVTKKDVSTNDIVKLMIAKRVPAKVIKLAKDALKKGLNEKELYELINEIKNPDDLEATIDFIISSR